MALDPSKLFVGSAGFVQDWLLTREWKRILVAAAPLYVGIAVLGVVFWSSRSNKAKLAQWYLELGNEEIADWENAWAPVDEASEAAGSTALSEENDETQLARSDELSLDKEGGRPKVSPFAETLFRRVQMLNPGDRSQYIIGATLAQQGAVGQAEQLLTGIAPNEGAAGYAPAHLILAELYRARSAENPAKYKPWILHHLAQAARWSRMPLKSLTGAAQLFANESRFLEAANFQAMAAERDPAKNIGLARLARKMENPKLAERATRTAEEYLQGKLKEDPQDLESRLQLATLYGDLGKLDEVQQVLFEGINVELTPEFRRAQSQFYVLKFTRSFTSQDGKQEIKIGFLEAALQLDPSNPVVAQQVAALVRMGAATPSGDLLDTLRTMVASGQATTVTHALMAETYLDRGDMKAAIPHLEQVARRAPTQSQYLNNLAYCLAKVQPERIDEAVQLASRAVATANETPVEPVVKAEFFDTLSMVLDLAGRGVDAITAIESAIQLTPKNPLYHESAAKLYRKSSDEAMAEVHDNLARKARESQASADDSQPESGQP